MEGLANNTNLRESLNLGNMHNLRSGNTDISNVIINPEFLQWEKIIPTRLVSTLSLEDDRYTQSPDSELFMKALEHASRYNKPIKAENIIALTHPLYLHLTDMEHIKSPLMEVEAENYLNNLLWLLELKLPKEKVGIVVLECLYHYAAATSLLLEAGLIDRVIFTDAHDGTVRTEFESEPTFEGKQIFVGGGYNFYDRHNYGCLAETNGYLKGKVRSSKNFWAIQDLILNRPGNFDWFIMPKNVLIGSIYRKFPSSRVISLEETLKKIGCEKYLTSH